MPSAPSGSSTPAGTYTWIPFGGGVRRCIGAVFAQFEMRVILRAVLERVRLRSWHDSNIRSARKLSDGVRSGPSLAGRLTGRRR